jgi:hypothetical protein
MLLKFRIASWGFVLFALALAAPHAHAMGPIYPGPGTICTRDFLPIVTGKQVSVPNGSKLLSKGNIHYHTGRIVDLSLLTEPCIEIARVTLNGANLLNPSQFDPVEGSPSTFYEVLSRQPAAGNKLLVNIRLHLADLRKGIALNTAVHLYNPMRTGPQDAVAHPAVFASVADVNSNAQVRISETSIKNRLLINMFSKFGDRRLYEVGGRRLYDPDYDRLELRIDSGSVYFAFAFKARQDNWCDPSVSINGRFQISSGPDGIRANWINGPNINPDFAWHCDAVTMPLFLHNFIRDYIANEVRDSIKQVIDQELTQVWDTVSCGTLGCDVFIQSLQMIQGAIVVNVLLPIDNVTIEVPYTNEGILNPTHTQVQVELPLNETLVAVASSASAICVDESRSIREGCAAFAIDSTGTYLNSNVPELNGPGMPAMQGDRLKVFNLVKKASRRMTMPRTDLRAGVPIVRDLGAGAPHASVRSMAQPCGLWPARTYPSNVARLSFGVNDSRRANGGEFGRGTIRLTLGWSPFPSGGCPLTE